MVRHGLEGVYWGYLSDEKDKKFCVRRAGAALCVKPLNTGLWDLLTRYGGETGRVPRRG